MTICAASFEAAPKSQMFAFLKHHIFCSLILTQSICSILQEILISVYIFVSREK